MKTRFLLSFLMLGLMLGKAQYYDYDYLDVNQIKAKFSVKGINFYDSLTNMPSFEVHPGQSTMAISFSGLVVGAMGPANKLHLSGLNMNSQPQSDYYPGPVMNAASYSAVTDAYWNNIWRVRRGEIDTFRLWLQNPAALPGYTIPLSISSWPANGDTTIGQLKKLAPYVDANGDGVYIPADGDYPCIKGDLALYYIMNDDRGSHIATNGQKLGIEIRVMAYAFNNTASQALQHSVFTEYVIINRSDTNYTQTRLGVYDDFVAGNYFDNVAGTDVVRGMTYCYNGDNNDEFNLGAPGFGSNLPAIGHLCLKGPKADLNDGINNDHDSLYDSGTGNVLGALIDEPDEWITISKSIYVNNNIGAYPPATTFPDSAHHYYNYLNAMWKDSTYLTYGGDGYFSGGNPASYICPWDSDPQGYGTGFIPQTPWLDLEPPSSRSMFTSYGAFTFNSGDTATLSYAYVFAQDPTSNLSAVNALQFRADSVLAFYNDNLSYPSCSSGDGVWPGDVNNDRHVNNHDVLDIGIGFATSGNLRPSASQSWLSQPCTDWPLVFNDGANYKYADCNGDGTINYNDTNAISQNYGLTHYNNHKMSPQVYQVGGTPLEFDIPNAVVNSINDSVATFEVPVLLGEASTTASNIYGLAFSVNYDSSVVQPASVWFDFNPTWLGSSSQLITFSVNQPAQAKIDVAEVRNDQANISGYGTIGKCKGIITIDNLSGKLTDSAATFLSLYFSGVSLINNAGNQKAISPAGDSLLVTGSALAIPNTNTFIVFPNPTDGQNLNVRFNNVVSGTITIRDLAGRILISKRISSENSVSFNLTDLKKGTYLIHYEGQKGEKTIRKLIKY